MSLFTKASTTSSVSEERIEEDKPITVTTQFAEELMELETLIFEAMDAMHNRSNLSGVGHSLNTAEIMNLFIYLNRFFHTFSQTNESICRVAAEHITVFPNFLRMTFDVVLKYFFGKSSPLSPNTIVSKNIFLFQAKLKREQMCKIQNACC